MPQNTQRNTRKLTPEMEVKKWRPGQSGNPAGRPRTRLLSEAYRIVLADLEDTGNFSVAEKIAKAMARKAVKGNVAAAKEMADRTEGRAIQASLIAAVAVDENTTKRIADLAERLLPYVSTAGASNPSAGAGATSIASGSGRIPRIVAAECCSAYQSGGESDQASELCLYELRGPDS